MFGEIFSVLDFLWIDYLAAQFFCKFKNHIKLIFFITNGTGDSPKFSSVFLHFRWFSWGHPKEIFDMTSIMARKSNKHFKDVITQTTESVQYHWRGSLSSIKRDFWYSIAANRNNWKNLYCMLGRPSFSVRMKILSCAFLSKPYDDRTLQKGFIIKWD